jgi:hypothetical protein
MKATMIAFALILGLTGGTTLIPSGQAHATTWNNGNGGGALGSGGG